MIRFLFPRYAARRRYFQASEQSAQAWAEFTAPGGTWVSRWNALREMADCERTIAETVFGFPHAHERDENGFTIAQSNAISADLLELVAGTEIRIESSDNQACDAQEASAVAAMARTGLDADPTVSAVLAQIADTTEPAARAEQLAALYNAVVDRVGGQAAEVLVWVAHGYYVLSGLSLAQAEAAWRTVRERSNGGGQS
jgi:hypothetical protein